MKGKVSAICLVAVSLVWLATSCGEAEGGAGTLPAESGMESFAFRLTTEGEDGGSRWVEATEGVYDPTNGSASAVHTGSGRDGEDRLLMVDGVLYLSSPDLDREGLEDLPDPSGSACLDAEWQSAPVPEPTGALIDINNPTGLQIEALQEMVANGADQLQPLPADAGQPDGTQYSVDVADIVQDDYRELLDMVVTVDDIGRVVSVDWTVSADIGGGAPSTEEMALTLSEFGVPVEAEAPAAEDTCDWDEMSLETACGFGATDVREEATGAIAAGDRQELTEIVNSFNTSTGGTCPESLSVPLLVSSARCDPGMVQFLFEDLEFDPNWTDQIGMGTTALFDLTYYDPEDDPEFSQICTPEQDLETIRVLLDAGADPCLAPDAQNGLGPLPGEPQWEAPAVGISEWSEPAEIVELVERAATTCTP